MRATFLLVIGFIFFISCNNNQENKKETELDPTSKTITKSDFKLWPFTIEKGVIKCVEGLYLLFEVNGKTYGINGAGQQYAEENGGNKLDEIWAIDEKFKKEMMAAGSNEKSATIKISLREVLEFGQALCKNKD